MSKCGDSLDKTWKDEEERSGERSEETPFYSSAMAVLSQQDLTLGTGSRNFVGRARPGSRPDFK
jgi:hypothetical protein